LFAVFGSDSLVIKGTGLLLVVCLGVWSERSARTWGASLRFVVVFAALLFVVQVLAIRTGDVVFSIGVPITMDGIQAGANMALRFFVILSSSFLFAVTTDPDALAGSFIRWGIPYRYGFTLILALRFVPFFRNELRIVREAQRLRGVRVSVRSVKGIRQAIRYTFVPVLVSGLLRVDTIAMSMKGRAFGIYRRRTATRPVRPHWEDGLIWVCCAGLISLTLVSRRFGWM
jgi:energy-coupling factor transport system permease protein